MPEYTEVLGSYYTIRRWFDAVKGESDLQLKGIWTDATKPEIAKAKKEDPGSREAAGHLYKLRPTSKVVRGSQHAQKPIWPHVNCQPVEMLDGFELEDVRRTPRTCILDFRRLGFQVCFYICNIRLVITQIVLRSSS